MNGIRNLFKELLRNPDDLMLREEILAVLDFASCSYYYRLYKKIVG